LSKGTDGKKERPCDGLYPGGGDSVEDATSMSDDLPLEIRC
jgi:hypothetical protein